MPILTPGEILDHATAVNTDVRRLGADIGASEVSDAFRAGWDSFAAEWTAFYDSLSGASGYLSRLWAGSDDTVDSYRARLVEWQRAFRSEGGSTTGPAIEGPAATSSFNLLGDVKWIVLGAAVVLGLVLYARR